MEKVSFWSKLKNLFSWLSSIFFNTERELTILGLQNAGKTTLVNVLANGKFDEDTIPTIGFNFRKITKGKVEFKLWDLGNYNFSISLRRYIKKYLIQINYFLYFSYIRYKYLNSNFNSLTEF